VKGALLLVPAFERGRGGGHLVRSLALLKELRSRGRDSFLYVPPGEDPAWGIRREAELSARPWDFIILDRFKTPPEEFEAWAARAPLIGIDEGGPAVKDLFFRARTGDRVSFPVNNVTKCGNIISAAPGRDDAAAAERAARMVLIRLEAPGEEG
jgi:hypothetical protein